MGKQKYGLPVCPKLLGSMGGITLSLHWMVSREPGGEGGTTYRRKTRNFITETCPVVKFLDLHEAQFPLLGINLPQRRVPAPGVRAEPVLSKCRLRFGAYTMGATRWGLGRGETFS